MVRAKKNLLFFFSTLSLFLICNCGPETRVIGKIGKDQPGIFFSAKARAYWPTQSWRIDNSYAEKLKALDTYLFSRSGDDKDRKGIRTNCVVIIKDGQIIYERYARGYDKTKPHLSWSVSKSFVNALYGMAIKDGKTSLGDRAVKYYPSLKGDGKEKIAIKSLLQMSSGLYWNEGYESSPLKSSVIAMLYTRGRRDMAAFAAEQPVVDAPGRLWYYSSGTSNLLMAMFKNIVGPDNYKDYAWQRLFNVLGMKSVVWESDAAGTYVGSSYLYATARDLARFGFLYLNDGIWQGKQLLPKGWVTFTTEMAPAFYHTALDLKTLAKDNPGAHWWLNKGAEELGVRRPWPDLPKDTFAAVGHWGQKIMVIPSEDLVLVRLADDRDKTFSVNQMGKLLLQAVKK